jgi:cholesterol oxidase
MRYDVVVIGSGFGGAVAALRLAEKGYTVGVLEAGRRFADDEFPQT